MNVLIVNMSPRARGTSAMLAGMCAERLEGHGHTVLRAELYRERNDPQALYAKVAGADVLVLSGPCYINTYPADVTAFLEGMAARPDILHGQALYGMIQGGMPYVHTHEGGLSMLRVFARRTGLRYLGGFVMGMGAMVDGGPIDKLLNAKKARRQLTVFFDHVCRGEPSPREVYLAAQMKIPALLARLLAAYANRAAAREARRVGAAQR